MEKNICINCNEEITIGFKNRWFHTLRGMYRCDGRVSPMYRKNDIDIAIPVYGHKGFLEELRAL